MKLTRIALALTALLYSSPALAANSFWGGFAEGLTMTPQQRQWQQYQEQQEQQQFQQRQHQQRIERSLERLDQYHQQQLGEQHQRHIEQLFSPR